MLRKFFEKMHCLAESDLLIRFLVYLVFKGSIQAFFLLIFKFSHVAMVLSGFEHELLSSKSTNQTTRQLPCGAISNLFQSMEAN